MKRVFSIVASLILATITLVSCQEKIDVPESAGKHSVHFTVNLGEATKTVLDGTTVNWVNEDASLFHVFENGVEATGDDLLVEFPNGIATVTALFEDTDATEFTYTAYVASLNTNDKPTVLKTQTPTPTSFDPAADVLFAKPITLSEPNQDADLMFQFARPVSINKMTLVGINAGETIQKVVLEGNKSLGGSYDPDKNFQYSASDKLLTINTSSNVVYFVTAAVSEVTPTITVTTDNAVYSKTFGKPITFVANELHSFSVSFSENDRYTDDAEYGRVTNVNDLAAGDVIVLGCAAKNKAAGVFGGNKYFSAQDATISEEGILKSANAVEITLGKDGDSWTLTTEEGKIGATAAKALSSNSGTDTWNISFTEERAIISSTNSSYGSILYNASTPRFLNYASGQTSIEIYKKGFTPTAPTTYTVTIDNSILNGSVTANPTTAIEGTTVTLIATPEAGFEFVSWNVTGATVADATNATTTFTMPAADVRVSATFKEIETLKTMDEIFDAAITAGSTATDARVTFNNWVVSGVKTSNAYVTDGTKGFIIYGSNHGFEVGDVLSGTVNCKVQLYNGSAELTALTSTSTGLTVLEGGVVAPQTISIAELSGVNTGAVLTFEELTYNGSEFTDGANTIKPYNTFITLPILVSGRKYSVTGVYVQFKDTKEIAPRAENDFVLILEPYLGATAAKTTIAAAGETVHVTVIADQLSGDWSASSSNTAFTIDNKTQNGFDVVVSENTSTTDSRTATITVSADGVDDVVITLTQNKKSTGGDPVTKSVDLTAQGYTNAQEVTSVEIDENVTATFDKGTSSNAPKYYTSGTAVRCYGGNTITVTAPGKTITAIKLTYGSSDGSNAITTDVDTFTSPNWSGESEKVVFTIGGSTGNRRIQGIEVTYK